METINRTLQVGVTTIAVGNVKSDACITSQFTAKRGGLSQSGKITMTNRFSTMDVSVEVTGDELGITYSGSVSGDSLILSATVDTSSTDGVIVWGSLDIIKL
jgi:hypothetical protein